MKILSQRECNEWVRSLKQDSRPVTSAGGARRSSVSYRVVPDSGKKIAIARALVESINNGEGLFQVTGWGIFPSSENMQLFRRLRQAMGDTRELIEAPGHLFRKGDEADLECLLDLTLFFFWDAHLICGSGTLDISLSHDELIEVSGTHDRITPIAEVFESLSLPRLGERTST